MDRNRSLTTDRQSVRDVVVGAIIAMVVSVGPFVETRPDARHASFAPARVRAHGPADRCVPQPPCPGGDKAHDARRANLIERYLFAERLVLACAATHRADIRV